MFAKLEKFLTPVADKLGKNVILIAIRDGFLVSSPLIIVGSIFLLVANFPIPNWSQTVAGVFGEGWEQYFTAVSRSSFDMISLFASFGIAYSYAKQKDVNPVSAGAVALASFIILSTTIHANFVNADGNSFVGLATESTGSKGLFTAMVVSLIAASIFVSVTKRGWVIKLPDAVPPAVSASFAALIPTAIIFFVFFLVRIGFAVSPYGTAQNFVFVILQTPLGGLGKSFGFEIIYQFLSTLFWFFGVNGPAVTNTVFSPIHTLMTVENLEAFQAGTQLPNIFTGPFSDFFCNFGGAGSTLSLVILMLTICKSERLKQLGRLSIVPGIFGINEPIIFGLPVVLNPIIVLPFILVPVVNTLISQLATMVGILPYTTGVTLPWATPIGFSGFIATNSIIAPLFQFGLLALGCLIYLPFVKILDKEYLKEESGSGETEDELDSISFEDLSFE